MPTDNCKKHHVAFDLNEVVKFTKIGRTKIYEEIKTGRLKARKVGRRTVVLHEDLISWLKSAPLMHGETA